MPPETAGGGPTELREPSPVEARTYQILDVGLTLEAPQGAFLEAFHQDYGRFEATAFLPDNRLNVRYEDGSLGGGSYLEVDGLREDLNGHPRPEAFAAQALGRILMERVSAFTVLHAATLASTQGALAVSGTSGAGKTTLTLALLEAGWSYYSDDFCPVHRKTGLVHPFPRSLWVRPPGQKTSHQRTGKVLFPVEGQGFSIGGPPRPLRWLVCLGAEDNDNDSGRNACLRLNLRKGLGGPLLDELQRIEGAVLCPVALEDSLRWTLRYPRAEGRTRKVKELLHRHREAIWNEFSQPETHPDFSREPILAEMPPHEAAFFLLQELKHDLAEVLRPGAMRPGALLSHLVDLLSGVACYRLRPGPLDRCMALIQAATDTVEAR